METPLPAQDNAKKYGQRMYEVIEQNPYRLADDISGI